MSFLKFFYINYIDLLQRLLGFNHVVRMLESVRGSLIPHILVKYNANIGQSLHCKGGLIIENATGDEDSTHDFSRLRIGSNCFIGRSVVLDLTDQIILGSEVAIGSRVCIITHSDFGERQLSRIYPRTKASVRIGEGSYIGTGAIILQGVQLGRRCIVGAGAVVVDSFPDDSVIVGVPAKILHKSL